MQESQKKKLFNFFQKNSNSEFLNPLLSSVKYHSTHPLFPELSSPKNHLFSYKVQKNSLNGFKSAHGGAIATLIDELTSMCITILDKKKRFAVSIKLDVAYIKACYENDVIFFLCKVQKAGRNVAYSTCEVFTENRIILYTGSHIKSFLEMGLESMGFPKL